MAEIFNVASIEINAETEKSLKALKTLVKATNNEEGCLSYRLLKDNEGFNKYIMLEHFKDAKAAKAHQTSDHFLTFVKENIKNIGLKVRQGKFVK